MANTYAGEMGIDWQGREYLFRPSLSAIASLGTPTELVQLLKRCQSAGPDGFLASLSVLLACYQGEPEDLDRLTGYVREHRGRLRFVMGAMQPSEVHIIGARLAVAGMVGEPKRGKGDGKEAAEFDPAEYVGVAQAHLGMSSTEAWQMTMIELQRAIDAKFPPSEEEKRKEEMPTEEQAEAVVAHVKALRRQRQQK